MQDLKNNIDFRISFNETLSGTTPSTPAAIDRKGFESVTYVVSTGAVTDAGTAAGIVFELQESDDNSSYTAVADKDLLGTEAGLSILLDTQDNVVIGRLGYVGGKRYTKLVATGSTGTNAVVLAHSILGTPDIAPVA
jgi:hypothetical protein